MDQVKGDRFNGHSISIGVFAHNEERNILSTLQSLMSQDLFRLPHSSNTRISVSVIANGCTDATVRIASDFMHKQSTFDGQVIELQKAGKSNAWNQFVHRPEFHDVDYFVCTDSDIEFGSSSVISTLIERLSCDNEAYLAVDVAKKDTELKARKTSYERLSLLFSRFMRHGSTSVAGSLYCAKGHVLRRVHMPEGLPVEDGFLRAMLVTDLFKQPDNTKRILVVNDVWHYFTPDSSLSSLLRHEERLLIGTYINSVIYGFLWSEVSNMGLDAGELISNKNRDDPLWVEDLLSQHRQSNQPLISRNHYTKYWNRWKQLPSLKKVVYCPLMIAGTFVRYILISRVKRHLKGVSGLGHW
jgi:glycosyltransferase involved in cell wall biosynthesis